jgi:hypothetical protein
LTLPQLRLEPIISLPNQYTDITPQLSILVYLILFPPNYLPRDAKEVLQKDEEVALHQNGNGNVPYTQLEGRKE